jgi:hypothetical protein
MRLYNWFVITFRQPLCLLFAVLDALVHAVENALGLLDTRYLEEWERRVGPLQPASHPPPREPGEPPYEFSWTDTSGSFRAAVVAEYLPVEQIRGAIPDYLELAPQDDAPAGTHPVALIFGFEMDVKPYWWPFGGPNYLEFIIAVPDTRFKNAREGYTGPFFYMPQLRMNRVYPFILGRLVGYLKVLTRFEVRGFSFAMRRLLSGQPVARFEVQPVNQHQGGLHQTTFARWKERLNQPMASKLAISDVMFTHYQFEWNKAIFQEARATLHVEPGGAIPILKPGEYAWQPLAEGTTGAMLILLPFEWLMPFRRGVLDRHAAAQPSAARAAGG